MVRTGLPLSAAFVVVRLAGTLVGVLHVLQLLAQEALVLEVVGR